MKTGYSFNLKFLFTLCLSLLPLFLFAQETSTCAENLKTAQTLFDKGQINEVPAMLRDCMKSGFKREEQIAAYKLLIQSFVFEDKLSLADSTMLEFLKKNPEYQLSQTDHSSFVNLYNTFRVKPVFQLSVRLGTNIPFTTFVDPESTSGTGIKAFNSAQVLNFFGSLEGRIEITKKIEANFEAGFSQLSFTNTEDFPSLDDIIFARTTYKETQTRIELPLTVNYNVISSGKLTFYARAGAGPAILLSSKANCVKKPTDVNNRIPNSGPDLDRKDSRIKADIFAQIGAGAKFKIRLGYLFAEMRSNFGLINQTVRGGVSSEELRTYYGYVDDDFHLNAFNINLGYTLIFYKPLKRKE